MLCNIVWSGAFNCLNSHINVLNAWNRYSIGLYSLLLHIIMNAKDWVSTVMSMSRYMIRYYSFIYSANHSTNDTLGCVIHIKEFPLSEVQLILLSLLCSIIQGKHFPLYLSDIASLYHNHGVSDGVIDFCEVIKLNIVIIKADVAIDTYKLNYRIILPEEVGRKAAPGTIAVAPYQEM